MVSTVSMKNKTGLLNQHRLWAQAHAVTTGNARF